MNDHFPTKSTFPAIGVDARKYPVDASIDASALLSLAAEERHAGVSFRTLVDLSPDLDVAFLRDVRAQADELGLYLEVGLGHVNPFNSSEDPSIRALGDGDFVAGARRIIEGAAAIGCRHLWASLASYQRSEWAIFEIDRFRTDVDWVTQVDATAEVLRRLSPILTDNECTVALETHEEVTSRDLLRIADRVGHEAVSVTFDPANSVLRGEDPAAVLRRIAPLVSRTHLRDVRLVARDGDVFRSLTACGDGCLDWDAMVKTLREQGVFRLTIENATDTGVMVLRMSDPRWQADPGMSDTELARLRSWVEEGRIEAQRPLDAAERRDFVDRSRAVLTRAWEAAE